jgi:hypothetical protein
MAYRVWLWKAVRHDSAAPRAGSPVRLPVPNGAATTRSFVPAVPPLGLAGRGAYLAALPAGVTCALEVADLAL